MLSEFTAHCLRFEAKVERTVDLAEPGSMLRGALFHALRGRPERPGFCLAPARSDCHGCPSLAGCPVSFLLCTVDEAGRRGADVPRPYVVQAPEDDRARYEPGQSFSFGITVFGRAVSLFPYLIVATRRLEEEGLGQIDFATRRRGRFRIARISAANPLTGDQQTILQAGDELVAVPAVPVRHEQVLARSQELAARALNGTVIVDFLSNTRLIEDGYPLRRPAFRPLVQRLIERLSSLWERYGGDPLPIDYPALIECAAHVRLVADDTRWRQLRGYSTRQRSAKYLDGFVGRATFEGDLTPLLPWLIWGEITHVGKDAVKGCGRIRIENGVRNHE